MGRVNTPHQSVSERNSLEILFKNSNKHSLQKRCQTILLKLDGRTSKDVCKIVGMSNTSVNSWLNRYKLKGISGLDIKPGRGCKPKREKDEKEILASTKRHRQRLATAKAEWKFNNEKSVIRDTFRRFLKVLADDTSEAERRP